MLFLVSDYSFVVRCLMSGSTKLKSTGGGKRRKHTDGGPGRGLDTQLELQLSTARVHYEIYPKKSYQVSQPLSVKLIVSCSALLRIKLNLKLCFTVYLFLCVLPFLALLIRFSKHLHTAYWIVQSYDESGLSHCVMSSVPCTCKSPKRVTFTFLSVHC